MTYQMSGPQDFPGRSLGIAALVVNLISIMIPIPIVGLVLGHGCSFPVKKANMVNTPAFVGVIVGWILTTLWVFFFLVILVITFWGASIAASPEYGNGVVDCVQSATEVLCSSNPR